MDDDLNQAVETVHALLTRARELAWEAFDSPSEASVMALFDRLRLESDMRRDRDPIPQEPGDERVLH